MVMCTELVDIITTSSDLSLILPGEGVVKPLWRVAFCRDAAFRSGVPGSCRAGILRDMPAIPAGLICLGIRA